MEEIPRIAQSTVQSKDETNIRSNFKVKYNIMISFNRIWINVLRDYLYYQRLLVFACDGFEENIFYK